MRATTTEPPPSPRKPERPPWGPTYGLVAVLVVILAVTAWYVFEPPPMTYANLPLLVLNGPVPAGQAVHMHVTRCAATALPYRVSRNLRNVDTGEIRILPGLETDVPGGGCLTVLSTGQLIPADVPSGTYVLYGPARLYALMRPHVVEWTTAPFAVQGAA